MVKFLEKKLPQRDKKNKELWRIEEENNKKAQKYYEKENIQEPIIYNITYVNVSDIAKHFHVEVNEINKLFINLGWITQSGKWYLTTSIGKNLGGIEKYNNNYKQKYVVWENDILNNKILISNIEKVKQENKSKIAKTYKEKKDKGDSYEDYIAEYFRNLGHTVWEHGKEKGVNDGGLDLFIKDGRTIYFVQCKNWDSWKINLDKVQAIQTKMRNILIQKPQWAKLMKDYEKKIMYVAPKDCLTKGAYKYIQDNKHILEFKKIEIV